MVGAGHTKIPVWLTRHMIFLLDNIIVLSYVVAKSLAKTIKQNCAWQAKGENVLYQVAQSLNTMIVTHFASSTILSPILFTKKIHVVHCVYVF